MTYTFTLPNVRRRSQKAVVRLLQLAALHVEREAKLLAPRDTGALARSIVSEVRAPTARIFSPLAYASVVEYGRRPGARMPPPGVLVGWIRRHGFGGSPFVLARAIGRRGIPGRFFFRRAVASLKAAMPGLVRQALRETA